MLFEISVDDGSRLDLKFAELLRKYGLTATFYVPIDRELDWQDVIKLSKEFEIGSHTISHPSDIKLLTYAEQYAEIQNSKDLLESILNKEVTKFCYPRGRFDVTSLGLVREAGYKEARTTKVLHTKLDFDLMQKPTTIHIYDRKEYKGQNWFDKAIEIIKERPAYFHLWGHSHEIERYNNWDRLETFFKYIKEKGIA
jgi:peptidoglycan-N-acetylglucosamine deacetylase